MLKIYYIMLDVIRAMRPVLLQIELRDRELGKSACRDTAEAQGYIPSVDPRVRARLAEVIGTLVNIAR